MALTRITKGVIKPNENYDTHNIVSTGIVTSVGLDVNGNADISGSLSVGGVLTYEDVTSIDSVGIITARSGLVSPYADIDDFVSVGNNIHLGNAGVITATSFVGSGAALTGIDATAIKDSGGNVKVQAQASGAVYTGIHTFSSGAEVGSNIKLGNAGVITATSFVGSGAALTGIDATAVKDSGGNVKIQAQASGAVYTGIHTFGTNTNFTDIDVDGHTNLDNVNVAGVSTFAGTLNASTVSSTAFIASGDLDVDGHTNLDNVSVAGVSTFTGNIDANGNLDVGGSGGITISNSGADLTMNSAGSIFTGNGGNATDPIVANVSDTNTGFFYPAADTLAVTTGGSERLQINSSGDYLFLGGTLRIKNSANNAQYGAIYGDSTSFHVNAGGNLKLYSGGGERIRLSNDGQISIKGTTTAFDTTGDLDSLQIYYETDSGQASIGPYSSGGSTHLSFYTNAGGAAATEKLRITSEGSLQHRSGSGVSYFNGASEYVFGSTGSSPPSGGNEGNVQIHTSKTRASFSINAYQNNAGAPFMQFISSRSGTVGTLGAVTNNNDYLGDIRFCGDDGAGGVATGATIQVRAKTSATTNGMAARIEFATAKDSSSTTRQVFSMGEGGAFTGESENAALYGYHTSLNNTNHFVDLSQWTRDSFIILELFGGVNPNSSGSGAYYDPVHMYIYKGTGWTGSRVGHYIYCVSVAPPARQAFPSGTGYSGNAQISAVWTDGSSTYGNETATSTHYIRLLIPNGNNSNNFTKQFRIFRRR